MDLVSIWFRIFASVFNERGRPIILLLCDGPVTVRLASQNGLGDVPSFRCWKESRMRVIS